MSDRRSGGGSKDEISDEINIKDDGDSGDDIEKEEERKEVVIYDKGAEDNFDDEYDHHD